MWVLWILAVAMPAAAVWGPPIGVTLYVVWVVLFRLALPVALSVLIGGYPFVVEHAKDDEAVVKALEVWHKSVTHRSPRWSRALAWGLMAVDVAVLLMVGRPYLLVACMLVAGLYMAVRWAVRNVMAPAIREVLDKAARRAA